VSPAVAAGRGQRGRLPHMAVEMTLGLTALTGFNGRGGVGGGGSNGRGRAVRLLVPTGMTVGPIVLESK
jgi:hypothetical protein